MFGKVAIVALFAIFAVPGDANQPPHPPPPSKDLWETLTTTWGCPQSDPHRNNSYFEMPLYYDEAVADGWCNASGAVNWPGLTALIYNGDPRIAVIYNVTERFVVGIQVALPVADVANSSKIINYHNIPGITPKTINGVEYLTAAVYFSKSECGAHQLWWRDGTKLHELPTSTHGLEGKATCIDGMGTVYSSINANTTVAQIPPWQVIAIDEQIVGVWFLMVGNPSSCPSQDDLFEQIDAVDVKDSIPAAPDCVIDAMKKFGVASMSIWFSAEPWKIQCSKSH